MCISLFTKTVTVVQYTGELKDFDTEEDLRAWFDLYKGLFLGDGNLCDDYSRETRKLAEIDGYFMSCELVQGGMCYQTIIFPSKDDPTKPDPKAYHIGNMAIVLNGKEGKQECWYIDLNWSKIVKLCDFYTGGKY